VDRLEKVWEAAAPSTPHIAGKAERIVSNGGHLAVVAADGERAGTTEASPAEHDVSISDFQRIASVVELNPHGQFSKWIGDHDIVVFRYNGEVKALSNICPHFGGPVGYHQIKDGVFTCLWHNYRFEAASGRCLNNKNLCLREYQVKVVDGSIWVRLVENAED
jgi:nitrite reductase (NADH) small subunit